jgi:RNA polymerase sigma factor (TIGR02999 family)
LATALYGELQRLAKHHLRGQRPGQSLRTTDLVHEAYLKLANLKEPKWKDRIQFLSLASLAMRSLLVDYARRRGYAKRGGNPIRVSLADAPVISEASTEVLAVDEALKRLSKLDSRKSQIVLLRYFGGLSIEETAEVMAISTGTVKREWIKAGAWLRRELRRGQLG